MDYMFESGELCRFPLVQLVYGVEYIPDEATYVVKDRSGTVILSGAVEGSEPFFTFDAPIVTESTPYWMNVQFSSSSYAGTSKYMFEVKPFMGIAASATQARRLLGVPDTVLPDEAFDFQSQHAELLTDYPELAAQPNLDHLVLLGEVVRLAATAEIWLPKSRSQDDVKESRFDIDFNAYRQQFSAKFYSELFRLAPELETPTTPTTLLQFVPVTDAFTGDS